MIDFSDYIKVLFIVVVFSIVDHNLFLTEQLSALTLEGVMICLAFLQSWGILI